MGYLFELKQFRKDKKIKQTELANVLTCNQSFISSIESFIRELPDDKFDILADKYGDISKYIITDRATQKTSQPPKTDEPNVSQTQLDRLLSIIESQQRTIEQLTRKD